MLKGPKECWVIKNYIGRGTVPAVLCPERSIITPSLHCQFDGACIPLAAVVWLLSWTEPKENLLLLLLCSVAFSIQTHDLVQSALSPVNMITASVDLMNFPVLFRTELSNVASFLSSMPCLHVFIFTCSLYWYHLQELQPGVPTDTAKQYPVSVPHN